MPIVAAIIFFSLFTFGFYVRNIPKKVRPFHVPNVTIKAPEVVSEVKEVEKEPIVHEEKAGETIEL